MHISSSPVCLSFSSERHSPHFFELFGFLPRLVFFNLSIRARQGLQEKKISPKTKRGKKKNCWQMSQQSGAHRTFARWSLDRWGAVIGWTPSVVHEPLQHTHTDTWKTFVTPHTTCSGTSDREVKSSSPVSCWGWTLNRGTVGDRVVDGKSRSCWF